jgi:hypothetical protein
VFTAVKPGVSARYVPSPSENNSVVRVVFLPRDIFCDNSPVSSFNSGYSELISEDLPTPDAPHNTHILPRNNAFALSMPSDVSELVSITENGVFL